MECCAEPSPAGDGVPRAFVKTRDSACNRPCMTRVRIAWVPYRTVYRRGHTHATCFERVHGSAVGGLRVRVWRRTSQPAVRVRTRLRRISVESRISWAARSFTSYHPQRISVNAVAAPARELMRELAEAVRVLDTRDTWLTLCVFSFGLAARLSFDTYAQRAIVLASPHQRFVERRNRTSTWYLRGMSSGATYHWQPDHADAGRCRKEGRCLHPGRCAEPPVPAEGSALGN